MAMTSSWQKLNKWIRREYVGTTFVINPTACMYPVRCSNSSNSILNKQQQQKLVTEKVAINNNMMLLDCDFHYFMTRIIMTQHCHLFYDSTALSVILLMSLSVSLFDKQSILQSQNKFYSSQQTIELRVYGGTRNKKCKNESKSRSTTQIMQTEHSTMKSMRQKESVRLEIQFILNIAENCSRLNRRISIRSAEIDQSLNKDISTQNVQ